MEAVLELGDGDLDVELAVAGEQVLVALGVAPGVEGEVLVHQPVQGVADLLLVPLRLGLDGEGHGRLGDVDPAELDRLLLGAQGVAGDGDLELGDAADVAGDQRAARSVPACPARAMRWPSRSASSARLFQTFVVGGERAGDDAQQRDLAGEGVGEGLEDQDGERPGGVGGERHRPRRRRSSPGTGARSAGEGRSDEDERRAAPRGRCRGRRPTGSAGRSGGGRRRGAARSPGPPARSCRSRRTPPSACRRSRRPPRPAARGGSSASSCEVGRDLGRRRLAVAVAGEGVGLHGHQVDDAGEVRLLADRDLDRQRRRGRSASAAPRARGRSRRARGPSW